METTASQVQTSSQHRREYCRVTPSFLKASFFRDSAQAGSERDGLAITTDPGQEAKVIPRVEF